MASAAEEKDRATCAALPRIDPEVAQHLALEEAAAIDADRNACPAASTLHWLRGFHACLSLLNPVSGNSNAS
jgi:hypothetical protein